MFSGLKKLRHRWLWYAAGGEALIVTVAVLFMAQSASAPPQVVVPKQHAPAVVHHPAHASLGHTAADK